MAINQNKVEKERKIMGNVEKILHFPLTFLSKNIDFIIKIRYNK